MISVDDLAVRLKINAELAGMVRPCTNLLKLSSDSCDSPPPASLP